MIGVDIVDLRAIQWPSASHRDRYVKKVFSPKEIASLDQQILDRNLAIWIGWAIKESVYKLEFRTQAKRYFRPKKLEILSINSASRFVVLSQQTGQIYQGQVLKHPDYVLAIASSNLPHIKLEVFSIPEVNSSVATRDFTLKALRERWGARLSTIAWRPFPIGYLSSTKQRCSNFSSQQTIPLSTSHHGRWACYAFYQAPIKQLQP